MNPTSTINGDLLRSHIHKYSRKMRITGTRPDEDSILIHVSIPTDFLESLDENYMEVLEPITERLNLTATTYSKTFNLMISNLQYELARELQALFDANYNDRVNYAHWPDLVCGILDMFATMEDAYTA